MNWDWVSRIRLGNGLIGKTGYTVAMLCIVCAAAIVFLPDLWKLVPLLLAAVSVILHQIQSFSFAKVNPILAVMDGVEAVTYLQTQVAASDPKIIEAASKPSANTAPNTLTYSGEGRKE